MENELNKTNEEGKVTFVTKKKVLISLSCFLLILAVSFVYYYFFFLVPEKRRLSNDQAYIKSLIKNDPVELQKTFLNDIRSGKNDKYTKSAAFFITHRYFDNGGNIYEIADYIKANPELAFLEEAKDIYPSRFKMLEDRKIKTTFSDNGMYILLAWLEVLDNHGYSDMAMTATLANQYAKLAYFMQQFSKDYSLPPEFSQRLLDINRDAEKALVYQKKTDPYVVGIFNNEISENDITPRDILVGLNQYAAASRYLQLLDKNPETSKTPEDVFFFSIRYSAEKVPELYAFTSLLNATTLAILPSSVDKKVAEAIDPFLMTVSGFKDAKKQMVPSKILASRLQDYSFDGVDYDMYGKKSTVLIALKAPEFKSWLLSNGWVESDFVLPNQK